MSAAPSRRALIRARRGTTLSVPEAAALISVPGVAGKARPGATFEEQRRMHAVARIPLDGLIPNVQVSWVKTGVEACQCLLQGEPNDFGGTLMEETISRMAGSEWGIRMEPWEHRGCNSRYRPRTGRAHDELRAGRARRGARTAREGGGNDGGHHARHWRGAAPAAHVLRGDQELAAALGHAS